MNLEYLEGLIEEVAELVEIVKAFEQIGIDTVSQIDNYASFRPEGVYCAWYGSVHYYFEDALEDILNNHGTNALAVAIRGRLELRDVPHIYNYNDDTWDERESSEEVKKIEQAFKDLKEIFKELKDEGLDLFEEDFNDITDVLCNSPLFKSLALEEELKVNNKNKSKKLKI